MSIPAQSTGKHLHTLVIVENDDIVQEGLASLVDWGGLGFTVAARLRDSAEAIAYLKEKNADVILSDLQPGTVSGLDLAQHISDNGLLTKIVLLSGHKDYEAAKAALNLKVENLLSKPIDMDELRSLFTGISRQLSTKREHMALHGEEERKQRESARTTQEHIIAEILTGALKTRTEIDDRLNRYWFGEPFQTYRCHLIAFSLCNAREGDAQGYDRADFFKALHQLLYADESFMSHAVHTSDGLIRMLAIDNDMLEKQVSEARMSEKLDYFCCLLSAVFGLQAEIVSYVSFENMYSLVDAHEAGKKPAVLDSSDLGVILKAQKKIMQAVRELNMQGACSVIDSVCQFCESKGLRALQRFAADMISMLAYEIKNVDIAFFSRRERLFDYLRASDIQETFELQAWVLDVVFHVINFYDGRNAENLDSIIDSAKAYIHDNCDKDISLNDVSNHVFFHPVYFSRFFKEKTGENFVNYLRKLRMEKAASLLLNPSYMIHQVSAMVGYQDFKYFAKLFKAHTGMTPSGYRRKYVLSRDVSKT